MASIAAIVWNYLNFGLTIPMVSDWSESVQLLLVELSIEQQNDFHTSICVNQLVNPPELIKVAKAVNNNK